MKDIFTQREDEILSCLDRIQPAELPPFFYTRLRARMQNEFDQKRKPFFYLRPAFMMASLSCILIINVIFLFSIYSRQAALPSDKTNAEATIESFSNSYDLATTSVYE